MRTTPASGLRPGDIILGQSGDDHIVERCFAEVGSDGELMRHRLRLVGNPRSLYLVRGRRFEIVRGGEPGTRVLR